jgi:hypothetical protein
MRFIFYQSHKQVQSEHNLESSVVVAKITVFLLS